MSPVPRTLALALCPHIMLVCPYPVPNIILPCLERRLWVGSGMAGGVQLTCCSQCMQRCGTSHCARALCRLSCILFCLNLKNDKPKALPLSTAARAGARGLMHALLISFSLSLSLSLSLPPSLPPSLSPSLSLSPSPSLSLSLSSFSLQQRPSQTWRGRPEQDFSTIT